MSGHASSKGEPEREGPSDVQSLPSAIPVFRPSGVRKPLLSVLPRCGSSGGEDRDSPEDDQGSVITMRSEGSLGINAPHLLPMLARAQHRSDGRIRKGRPYNVTDILR